MEALGISGFALLAQIVNFVIILFLLNRFLVGPITRILTERRARIEQGLKDAEQASQDREAAESERAAALADARREANEILARAQRVAQESREQDIAATRAELDRMRERATAEIQAEKQRALIDLRADVVDLALAAAGKVVSETMTGERQRRLVEDFLTEAPTVAAGNGNGGRSRT
ncbi:MAG TPA: F0F1 ATP synthase subunit B [Candidatus Limnocylindrales bacterium]|nr:F0F1 ATP synthase subunit B [Candidatus Limnocylindrales bacterium]